MLGWCKRAWAVTVNALLVLAVWAGAGVGVGVGVLTLSPRAYADINGPALTLEVTVLPQAHEKFRSAEFRIWIPEVKGSLRGVIIRQHGCGRQGLDHADDVQWQALALKHRCALLGSHLVPKDKCADWFEPQSGSERALLVALETFAEQTKRPELSKVPWAIWGHSGGALWAMHLLDRQPHRVAAVWARSQALVEVQPAARAVPVVLNYGIGEKTGKFESVHKNSVASFAKHRPAGALWVLAVDPKSSHDCRESRRLAVPWFDAVLALRLPEQAGGVDLRPLAAAGWLGDPETFAVAAVADYAGDKAKACWLPNEAIARKWQEYCKTGTVADSTRPPAPTQVRAILKDGVVTVSWSAVADLESGTKRFHIYRDGEKIGSLGGAVGGANKDGDYQTHNYGDEPEPRPAPLRYSDNAGKLSSRYEVTQENHVGLESPRSQVVVPEDCKDCRQCSNRDGQAHNGWGARRPVGPAVLTRKSGP